MFNPTISVALSLPIQKNLQTNIHLNRSNDTTMKLYDDPYNSDDLQKKSEDSSYRPRMIYFGILLILAGAIWLLNSFGIISRHTLDVLFSWQMLITVIGLYLVVQRQYYWGGITTVVGLCLLIFDLIHFRVSIVNVIFPLVLIMIGVATLLRLLKR